MHWDGLAVGCWSSFGHKSWPITLLPHSHTFLHHSFISQAWNIQNRLCLHLEVTFTYKIFGVGAKVHLLSTSHVLGVETTSLLQLLQQLLLLLPLLLNYLPATKIWVKLSIISILWNLWRQLILRWFHNFIHFLLTLVLLLGLVAVVQLDVIVCIIVVENLHLTCFCCQTHLSIRGIGCWEVGQHLWFFAINTPLHLHLLIRVHLIAWNVPKFILTGCVSVIGVHHCVRITRLKPTSR